MKGELTEMKCIYASKLYRASKRKDKIKAALANSANVGLVQQLADSLDEEYQTEELLNPQEEEAEQQNGSEGGQGAEKGEGGGSELPGSLASGLGGGSFNPDTDLVEFPEGEEGEFAEGDEGELPEGDEGESAAEELEGPDTGVKEATQIKACTMDQGQLTVLKDSLNMTEGLAGVTRVVVKENELWIYYNDDTNLNNIMTDVIEYVAQGYSYLEFNRLARSDNAIVFEIVVSTASTLNEIA